MNGLRAPFEFIRWESTAVFRSESRTKFRKFQNKAGERSDGNGEGKKCLIDMSISGRLMTGNNPNIITMMKNRLGEPYTVGSLLKWSVDAIKLSFFFSRLLEWWSVLLPFGQVGFDFQASTAMMDYNWLFPPLMHSMDKIYLSSVCRHRQRLIWEIHSGIPVMLTLSLFLCLPPWFMTFWAVVWLLEFLQFH